MQIRRTHNLLHAISMRILSHFCLKMRMNTACLLLAFAVFSPAHADANKDIQQLINRVGSLKEATFIRNDKSYSPAYAKEFLQRKWQAQCKEAASVQAFIELCASKSGTTGKPYLIKQGQVVRPAAEVLRELAAPASP
ncbi:MAG: hypothetical protein RL341_1906 [Pseudomonadota bacterium]|jgi:hypothetical protein